MEYIIEFLLDLFFDITLESLSNKKLPKWIRYPLGVLTGLLIFGIIVGVIILGILITQETLIGGIFIVAVGIFLLICGMVKTLKTIKQMRENQL